MKKTSAKAKTTQKSVSHPKVEVDKDSSVQVRKIENGFIVAENGSTGSGRNQKYYNKEYFSETNPLASVSKGLKFGKK